MHPGQSRTKTSCPSSPAGFAWPGTGRVRSGPGHHQNGPLTRGCQPASLRPSVRSGKRPSWPSSPWAARSEVSVVIALDPVATSPDHPGIFGLRHREQGLALLRARMNRARHPVVGKRALLEDRPGPRSASARSSPSVSRCRNLRSSRCSARVLNRPRPRRGRLQWPALAPRAPLPPALRQPPRVRRRNTPVAPPLR